MKNTHGPSIYFANDKSIFDALHNKSVTRTALKTFLKDRGIFVADNVDKEILIKYISKLTFDYFERQWLVKFFENPSKREKITSQTIKSDKKIEGLSTLCSQIKEDNENSEDSYRVSTKGDTTTVQITYNDFDLSKTDLKQRVIKTAEIELQTINGDLIIRSPLNEKCKVVTENIVTKIAAINNDNITQEKISLLSIRQPEARSHFFEELIKSISGYKLYDVTKVQVYKNNVEKIESDDNDDEELDSVEEQFAGFITKVALDGGGVLQSAEFQQLHKRGFYLSSVIWLVVDEIPGGEKFEVEALFSDPEQCSEFTYRVRGIYRYKSREATHNISRAIPSRSDTQMMAKLLEDASKKAYEAVVKKFGNNIDESSDE